jgi:hypothetical protein
MARAIAWLQGGAEQAGLRTGPVGTWVGAHKRALRIGAVVAAKRLVRSFVRNPEMRVGR